MVMYSTYYRVNYGREKFHINFINQIEIVPSEGNKEDSRCGKKFRIIFTLTHG